MRRAGGDLDGLDRATLLVWRGSNVIGWGAAGATVYVIPQAVFLWASDALQGHVSAVIAAPLLFLIPVIVLVVLPALTGRLVGLHVYRWPAVTAGLAVAIPVAWVASRALDQDGTSLAITLGFGLGGVLIAIGAARTAWLERPRALRVPSAR